MTNAEKLIDLFGGASALARELNVSRSVISRWIAPPDKPRGLGGAVPHKYVRRIIEASISIADREKHDVAWLSDVLRCLPAPRCPTCGHEIEPGRVL